MSTRPRAFALISSMMKPHCAAVAGFVPCADTGTSTRLRVSPSPRAISAWRIASIPHSSPCAPAFGLIATDGMPVSTFSQVSS